MNQKRFTTEIVDWWKTANQTKIVKKDGEWIDADDCATLLNAMYEQIKSTNPEENLEKRLRVAFNDFKNIYGEKLSMYDELLIKEFIRIACMERKIC